MRSRSSWTGSRTRRTSAPPRAAPRRPAPPCWSRGPIGPRPCRRPPIRASAGALLHVPTARVANISRAIDRLRDAGFTAVGLDGDAERSIYDEPCPDGRVALVVGAEGSGLSRLVREHCDLLVSLPMRGRVGSLNASASLAAALYAYVLPARAGAATSPG